MPTGPMRRTAKSVTIRVEPEVWELLQYAAREAGVSVSQYIREAVLARAVVGVDATFARLAQAAQKAVHEEGHARRRGPTGLMRAAATRFAAAETMRDSGALIAQSRQALRHAAGTLRESDAAAARRAGPARGRSNLELVAQLWRAFETAGAAAVADLVRPDVEWRPLETGGEKVRGTRGLREFWAPPNLATPTPQMFQAHGDDVLVHAERRCPHGGGEPLWLLYRFDGHRLVAADAFDDEQAALAALMRASAA